TISISRRTSGGAYRLLVNVRAHHRKRAQISVVVALSRHMVDTLPAASDVAFDHAPGSLFLRTRRGAACHAQRNNDRLNEASHPDLSRGLRQGRWRPGALTRNGSYRWPPTQFPPLARSLSPTYSR